jgi:hypothetical protein
MSMIPYKIGDVILVYGGMGRWIGEIAVMSDHFLTLKKTVHLHPQYWHDGFSPDMKHHSELFKAFDNDTWFVPHDGLPRFVRVGQFTINWKEVNEIFPHPTQAAKG